MQYGFSPLFSSPLPSPSPSSTPAKEVKCRTTCNLEFCNEGWRTNKYCSANEWADYNVYTHMFSVIIVSFTCRTAFMRVPEREPCQHTSCSACRFVLEPDCPTCPVPVKKRCLRHFELCVERHNARDDIILVRAVIMSPLWTYSWSHSSIIRVERCWGKWCLLALCQLELPFWF